jgi:MarR family transcriptional regulator for hemolysin
MAVSVPRPQTNPALTDIRIAKKPPFASGVRVLARLSRVAERVCLESGISLPQYRLLLTLADRQMRAGELAERVGVSRPTLTSLIDGLERQGLLRRHPVPGDRRGIRLEPTEKGLQALECAERALSERLLGLVDADTAQRMEQVVSHLSSALDREVDRAV